MGNLDKQDKRDIEVIVADGSSSKIWSNLEKAINDNQYRHNIKLLHHDFDTSFLQRLNDAVEMVTTPYVLLAADDDLYMFDWLTEAENLLNANSSFGVVYGHALRFELHRFIPYGKIIKLEIERNRNPPYRWLEGETPTERLKSIGDPTTDLATFGWYALQRTDLLKSILNAARIYGLNNYGLEKLMIVAQAALVRSRQLAQIHIARQVNRQERRAAFSYENEAKTIKSIVDAVEFLVKDHPHFKNRSNREILMIALQGEVRQLKAVHDRRYLRAIADCLPSMHAIWEKYLRFCQSKNVVDNYDHRFSDPPDIDLNISNIIINATKSNSLR